MENLYLLLLSFSRKVGGKLPILSMGFLMIYALFFLQLTSMAQNCTVNAGLDQTICASSTLTLYGTDAGLFSNGGQITWTQVSGPSVIITSPNSLTTTVTGYTGGNVYKFWLNSICADGSNVHDECMVTVTGITTANAGTPYTRCPGTYALAANAPGTGETGAWSITGSNNGITITTASSPTSNYTVSSSKAGATTLKWTITNSTTGCSSSSTVVITDLGGTTPVSAGSDILASSFACYTTTASTSLSGSFEGSGSGQAGLWTVVSGPNIPTFSSATSNTSSVSNLLQIGRAQV